MRSMETQTIQKITKELDKLAILYNKTQDKKYKEEWYKILKKIPKVCY